MNIVKRLASQTIQKIKSLLVPSLAATLVMSLVVGLVAPLSFVKKAVAEPAPIFNQHPNDEPTIQVRKNGTTTWSNAVTLADGETAQFFLYAHNNVTGSVAKNTKVKAQVPTSSGIKQTVTGIVSADNAATATGQATVNLLKEGRLEVNQASIKHFINKDGQYVEQAISNSEQLFTDSGLLLGDINGCWQYLRAITFTATVKSGGNATISTYKEVGISNIDNSWHRDGVTTTPGNVVAFHIYAENTGGTGSVLSQPTITDTLDNRLTYKPNSSYIITRNDAGQDVRRDIPDSYINFNGQTLTWATSDIEGNPARAVHLYFQATLAGNSSFPTGTQTKLLNKAKVSGKTSGNQVSADTNEVFIQVNRDATNIVKFDIEKVVRNLTTGSLLQDDVPVPAKAGDIAQYTIRVVNTGNTAATAQIKDILPTGVTLDGVVYLKSSAVGEDRYRETAAQGLFNGGSLTLTNVQPGNTNGFDLRFNVKVNANAAGTLTNTAIVSTDQGEQDRDSAFLLVGITTGYTVQKWVQDPASGNWVEETNTKVREGAILKYRIDIINAGNTQLKINSIRDVLPMFVQYIDNSLVMDPHISPTPIVDDNNFFNAGIGNFSIYPGVTKRFEFQAKVIECPIIGVTDLVNITYLRANDSPTEISDAAKIKLEVVTPDGNQL